MNVYIAGGTSGIGLALAKLYLSKNWTVAVCGRNLTKIDFEHPNLTKQELNVLNLDDLLAAVQDFTTNKKLDLFVNCTGSYADDIGHKIEYEQGLEILQTNIIGTINCLEVARMLMKGNQIGHIATIASISGILEHKNASIYSKTKTAVIKIADAYSKMLKPFGINITTIAPGYISTNKLRELNNYNLSKKPFLINEEEAAEIIFQAIQQNKELLVFPSKMKILIRTISILPNWLINIIMYKKAKWMKTN